MSLVLSSGQPENSGLPGSSAQTAEYFVGKLVNVQCFLVGMDILCKTKEEKIPRYLRVTHYFKDLQCQTANMCFFIQCRRCISEGMVCNPILNLYNNSCGYMDISDQIKQTFGIKMHPVNAPFGLF